MSAELRRKASAGATLRRILVQAIDSASKHLGHRRISDHQVHAARKQLKKARATLRLLRAALGERAYRRENSVLRDAARPLRAIRDAKVLLDALDTLAGHYRLGPHALELDALRQVLRRERTRGRAALTPAAIAHERAMLRGAAARVRRHRDLPHGWDAIGPDLRRTYARARKAMRAAHSGSTPALHEWRKQSKYIWNQLQLLAPLWPGMLAELVDQMRKLTAYLGDDHDLALLRDLVKGHPDTFTNAAVGDALLALIDRRRRQLQRKAVRLGIRIFEEKPRRFSAHLETCWEARQKQGADS